MSLRGSFPINIGYATGSSENKPPISRFDNVEALLKLLVPIQHHPPTL
jgi:hypothetical protein